MYPVSNRFRQAPTQNHQTASTCTISTPGGAVQEFRIADGSVQLDRTQTIRRTAPSLSLAGGTDAFQLLSVPGAEMVLSHGYVFGGADRELIPVLTGELTNAALPLGDGLIAVSVADRWHKFAACPRLSATTPDTAARRVDVIIATVQEVFPGIEIRNTATDRGTVGTAQAWTDRAGQVSSYATDGGTEAYFAPDGAFVLRDVPRITDTPVWTIKTGAGGTLKALTRTRPLDRLFNTVVLTPATADPAQTWSQVIVQITDPNDPRHPSRIGVRPYPYVSPTALTEDDAIRVGQQILTKITGTTETLDITAMGMAALDGGDIVRLLTPADSGDTIVSHFLQQMSINFATGDMSANTRSDQELAA